MRTSVFILAIAALGLVACGDDIEAHYRTYAELERAGDGARSWMPGWLPSSATDIYDWHNLDTNATRIRFSVPAATPAMLSRCRAARHAKNPGSAA